jgi:asparaginyl-tRNA synthetase
MNDQLGEHIRAIDTIFASQDIRKFELPKYDPTTHYIELARARYFHALLALRHVLKSVSDTYFSSLGALNIDLFMMTPSVSSPMGPGSDSEAVPIQFGKLHTYLVDSSQFGFEPLLMNGMDRVYCYLPSMRGETPDKRHLNQFFHCEAEIKGELSELLPIIEGYVHVLCDALERMPNIINLISADSQATRVMLERMRTTTAFKSITFDEAVTRLHGSEGSDLYTETEHGRDISSRGELELMRLLNSQTPLWVTGFDRDRVAFYQKPNPTNENIVINADLLFPPVIEGSFGGEIAGAGQRQDTDSEMYESLKRQGLVAEPYEWYINLRRQPGYQTTSGFGLGIERFITWILGRDDIKDAIIYPRLKDILTYP